MAKRSHAGPLRAASNVAAKVGMVIRTTNAPPSEARLGLPKDSARIGVSGSGRAVPLDAIRTSCGAGASGGTVGCASGFPTRQN